MKIVSAAILSAAMLIPAGCMTASTNPAKLAPGAVNLTDQTIYDSLMVAQASLNSLKTSAATNPSLKPYVNQAITDYDVAEAAWQTYHTAASLNPNISSAAAQSALNKVQADLSAAPKVN